MKFVLCFAVIAHLGIFALKGGDSEKPLFSTHANKKLLQRVLVPRLDLKEASLEETLEFLTFKMEDYLVQSEKIPLTFELTAAPELKERRITLMSENSSMWECLELISKDLNLSVSVTTRGVLFREPE